MGTSPLAVSAAAFVLANYAVLPEIVVAERWRNGADERGLVVDFLTPALKKLVGKVHLETDDAETLPRCVAAFEKCGFDVTPRILAPGRIERIQIDPGAVGATGAEGIIGRLIVAAESVLPPRDTASFPIERVTTRTRSNVTVKLPIKELRDGTLRPYAGDDPRRWTVRVYRDDKVSGQKLVAALRSRGFDRIRTCTMPDRVSHGFEVRRGGGAEYSLQLRETIREAIEVVMLDTGEVDHVINFTGGSDAVIEIDAPFGAAMDGSLDHERNDPGAYEVTIRADEPEAEFIRRELFDAGFRHMRTDSRPADGDYLIFDTAKRSFAKAIRDRLSTLPDAPALELSRAPGESNRRIIVSMTERKALRMHGTASKGWRQCCDNGSAHSGRPGERETADCIVPHDLAEGMPTFIERVGEEMRIGEHILRVRTGGHARVPTPPEAFTIDPETARGLAFLAEADLRRRSALLVGETGTSKTASVHAFAHLTGRPLYIVNFSEQTQLEDLVGQITPTSDWWEWTDGAVTRAMREGAVLLLDEVNLAPSSLHVRLHEVHERRPTLGLQERGVERVDAAEGFLLAAACNPVSYQGRQALSPDLIERYSGLRTGLPGAGSHVAFLRRCVFGEMPSIQVGGRIYRGGRVSPIYPGLAKAPGMDALLENLGRFHAEAQAAAMAAAQDGRGSCWTPVGACAFSRRSLARAIEDIHALVQSGATPNRAAAAAVRGRYLGLLTPDATAIVEDIAAANGLDAGGE